MTTPQILFCGEALIDFITTDGATYRATPGGSPFSASKAAAQAGARSGFCGAISTDIFGDQILSDLAKYGVETTFAPRIELPTALGFIQVTDQEHPKYAFFDRESAMVNMRPSLPEGTLGKGDVLGLGSISLVVAPGADNITEFALTQAKVATLAVDPNVRPSIIADHPLWRPRMDQLLAHADLVRVSTEDLEFYKPGVSPDEFANARLAEAPNLVIVTDGENGAEAWTRSGYTKTAGRHATGGDTVGAGDTLFGYSLAWLAEQGATEKSALETLGDDALAEMLNLATCAAALNCETVGCNPPARAYVDRALAG